MTRQWLALLLLAGSLNGTANAGESSSSKTTGDNQFVAEFVEANCLDCHDGATKEAGLALDALMSQDVPHNAQAWEKVVRRLSARQMPPGDIPRPDEQSYESVLSLLTAQLDASAERHPAPGRTESLRRMTRAEYQNAIRDLLAVAVDVATLLPADESSHGFDNVTVTTLSPTLLNRYVAAAEKISRIAVGRTGRVPGADTVRVRPDITQDGVRMEGLPMGTRGGTVISYTFPQDGEYDVQLWLMRDRNDEIEGLRGTHQLEVLLDRELAETFTIQPPPRGESDRLIDANLRTRLNVTAGRHDVAVTFVRQGGSLLESERQPLNVHYNFYRHPRLGPAVYQVSITGPHNSTGPGDSASRRRIFVCRPDGPAEQDACAEQILTALLRRAYRRPVDESDLQTPMQLYRQGLAEEDDFDAGIERAIAAILVNPHFLFRIERDPPEDLASDAVYRISDLELASRLSFFLWSSIPDEQLLTVAERGELSRPEVLEQQVRRMLSDDRSLSLVTNFADQWLYLRNLEAVTPDARLYPDFGHNLREAFRRETELLFEDVLRDDLSVLRLLDSPDTFLNERLARHYGIPHVYGSRFRRVQLDEGVPRGGVLRHGSILSVTSYANRTSPVLRGQWILENILGTPPPPPPPDIPALEENTVSADLPVRERLAAHRANAACAVCHDRIDPVGFGLENFDAVGRWRELELGHPVDASGGLPDGTGYEGVDGLEQALLKRPELFVQTLTEKLLTFALGRGIEPSDAPAVRRIVRGARDDDYRFSSLILGIVNSVPFQFRAAETGHGNQHKGP
jgi:hypothetical protein